MKRVILDAFGPSNIKSAWIENELLMSSVEEKIRLLANRTSLESDNWDVQIRQWASKMASLIIPENRVSDIETVEAIDDKRAVFACWILGQIKSRPVKVNQLVENVRSFSPIFRSRQIYSLLGGKIPDLMYVKTSDMVGGLANILATVAELEFGCDLWIAVVLSAAFVAIHPFPDENGRAARLLLTTHLQNSGVWNNLYLPIGFLFYRDRARFLRCQNGLFIDGAWKPYLEYMASAIAAAAELSVVIAYLKTRKFKNEI